MSVKVTIAGASGYIGKNLLAEIADSFEINALSRFSKKSEHKNIEWKEINLFSFGSSDKALAGTDVAIYLVHSMVPTTRLFQGSFEDIDLMIADNFARACKKNNVKQIIYLGGVVPQRDLSKHLESRKEVEDVFLSSGIPCTIFRAGLIVGNGGSSFEILKNLVINLPGMVLPKWTNSITQVIYISDVIRVIHKSINNSEFFGKTLNLVNGESLKYKDLIKETQAYLDKKALLVPVPINSTAFSKLWVTIFGETDYKLVSPLVDSLKCDFSGIKPDPLIEDTIEFKTFKGMLLEITRQKQKRHKKGSNLNQKNNVRSIQRLVKDSNITAYEAALDYLEWVPNSMRPFINIRREDSLVHFLFLGEITLLTLRYVPSPDMKDRAKFEVIGGILTQTTDTGWLEFRTVKDNKILLASINEFFPSLPWFIYKYSQAPAHKYVMDKFGEYLTKKYKK